jgi:hypothetical protein
MGAVVATDHVKRAERRDVSLSAKLQMGGELFACSMQNLSIGGAKIISDKPLNRGDTIKLVIGDFQAIDCEIVWARPPLFGMKFDVDAQEEVAEILMSVATYAAN